MQLFNYHPDNQIKTDHKLEKKIFRYSLIFPSVFIFLFWLVKFTEQLFQLDLTGFGTYPMHIKGIPGILFSPFIHSGYSHLIANAAPFFILSLALFYFYRRLAYRIFFYIYFLSGIFVWLGAREAWHIGASGVLYGLAAFLFFSGIFRNQVKLLTIAIVVVFLYGGMFWGIFPIDPGISWESHLWGGVSGFILAVIYRNQGPKRKKFEWEEESEENQDEDQYWMVNNHASITKPDDA